MSSSFDVLESSTKAGEQDNKQFVTMRIDGQLFGIAVLNVQDVLRPLKITKIPLAPQEILGSINLRGKIVTVIDMRNRLGIAPLDSGNKSMHIVVDQAGEQYSFVVDSVGEVMNLPSDKFERNPANLSEKWQIVSLGVYRLKDELLIVLDIKNILTF